MRKTREDTCPLTPNSASAGDCKPGDPSESEEKENISAEGEEGNEKMREESEAISKRAEEDNTETVHTLEDEREGSKGDEREDGVEEKSGGNKGDELEDGKEEGESSEVRAASVTGGAAEEGGKGKEGEESKRGQGRADIRVEGKRRGGEKRSWSLRGKRVRERSAVRRPIKQDRSRTNVGDHVDLCARS